MIDAMRRRADTHSSSSRLNETPNRAPFLRFLSPIPPSEGVFPPPNPPSQSKNVHAQRGFLNCFFWCGQPSARTFHEEEEDDEDEDVAVGLPDVSVLSAASNFGLKFELAGFSSSLVAVSLLSCCVFGIGGVFPVLQLCCLVRGCSPFPQYYVLYWAVKYKVDHRTSGCHR